MEDFILLLQASPELFAMVALVFGCIFGSLLNVLIHRIPIMMKRAWLLDCYDFLLSRDVHIVADDKIGRLIFKPDGYPETYNLFKPNSACPTCNSSIKPWNNIPIFSWLKLRGKCADCQSPIAVRYPLVELLTGVFCGALGYKFGLSLEFFAAAILVLGLICIALIDLDEKLIPDTLTLPLLWIGLMININGTFAQLDYAIIGAVVGYLLLCIIQKLHYFFKGQDGLGTGDFKLLAMLGAWFGIGMLPYLIIAAGFSGLLFLVVMSALGKNKINDIIPFGPHIALGGAGLLFFQQIIIPIWS